MVARFCACSTPILLLRRLADNNGPLWWCYNSNIHKQQQLNQKSDHAQTVSKELQHTHIHFDGLSDVLGALSAEDVAGEIEGRQRPNGRSAISKGGTGDIFLLLLALREESRHNNGARDAQLFAAEVGFSHIRLHGGGLLVAEGDRLQCPLGGVITRLQQEQLDQRSDRARMVPSEPAAHSHSL